MRRLAHSAGRHGRGARNGTPRRGPRRRESETCLRGYATVFHCGVADICELGLSELGDSEPTWGTHHLQEALIFRPSRQCCGLPLPQSASASNGVEPRCNCRNHRFRLCFCRKVLRHPAAAFECERGGGYDSRGLPARGSCGRRNCTSKWFTKKTGAQE